MQQKSLARTNRYVERNFGNTLVLVPLLGDLPAGDVVQLDTISIEIWNLIDGKKSARDIVARLQEEYHTSDTQLAKDVISFIDSLKKISALEEVMYVDEK